MLFPKPAAAVLLWFRVWFLLCDAYRAEYRKNKAAASRRRYQLKPDDVKAAARRSYQKHVERNRNYGREYSAAYRKKHPNYQREYGAKRRERVNAYARAWREKNQERQLDCHLRRTYGITLEEYNRLLNEQGGGCGICGKRKGGSKNQGVRLHVDHDHVTGKPRGLLCGTCNRGIGQFGDDPKRVRAAVRYLERARHVPAEEMLPLVDLAEDEPEGTVH